MGDDNFKKIDELTEKLSHGGKREGAGRKKKEPTEVIRVPKSMIPAIKALIESGGNVSSV